MNKQKIAEGIRERILFETIENAQEILDDCYPGYIVEWVDKNKTNDVIIKDPSGNFFCCFYTNSTTFQELLSQD